jgi:hypothetical protein
MALGAAVTFTDGQILTAANLTLLDTNIRNNALALISPLTGDLDCGGNDLEEIRSLVLDDTGDPIVAGQLMRNGTSLRLHNGSAALPISLVLDRANAAITVASTVTPTDVLLEGVAANLLGTAGRLRLTAIGRVSIRANHSLSITAAIQGVANLITQVLAGGDTTDRSDLPLRLVVEIWMNGTAASQRVSMESTVSQAATGTNSPAWGAAGASNTTIGLADAAVNMAVARTLQLYCTWSNADALDSVTFYQFLLELLN